MKRSEQHAAPAAPHAASKEPVHVGRPTSRGRFTRDIDCSDDGDEQRESQSGLARGRGVRRTPDGPVNRSSASRRV